MENTVIYYHKDYGPVLYPADVPCPDNCYVTPEALQEAIMAELSLEELVARYEAAIEERLETFAKQLYSLGYANACTYINSSVQVWALEAAYLIQLRDETWLAAQNFLNEVLPQVEAGTREVPTWEEVLEVLPRPAWPEGSRGYVGE